MSDVGRAAFLRSITRVSRCVQTDYAIYKAGIIARGKTGDSIQKHGGIHFACNNSSKLCALFSIPSTISVQRYWPGTSSTLCETGVFFMVVLHCEVEV